MDKEMKRALKTILRLPIVAAILILHGINPLGSLAVTSPQMRRRLSDKEKEYLINTCITERNSNVLREFIYER
jgi:hypothetical protein